MKITKYGHACLLVETEEARILIDPGVWNRTPDATDINVVLITHEHQDHLSIEQLREVLEKNPEAVVITHDAVGEILKKEGILYMPIENGGHVDIKGTCVESYGTEHAIVYGDASPCRNTGYLIGKRLFVPGDALHDMPKHEVEILALPTGAPWMKVSEAIDYAKALKPKAVFPIHDALYGEEFRRTLVPQMMSQHLAPHGIGFRDMADGTTLDF